MGQRASGRATGRRGQRLLRRHASTKPVVECAARDAERFQPNGQRLGLSVDRDAPVARRVPVLLFPGSPTAVLGLVVAIVVYAVKRVLRAWTTSHVFEEALERAPAVTDGDPSASVAVEEPMLRVSAPEEHLGPCLILHAAVHFASSTMSRLTMLLRSAAELSPQISAQATTALGRARREEVGGGFDAVSAAADAAPNDLFSVSLRRGFLGCKTTEALICKIVPHTRYYGTERVKVNTCSA